MSNPCAEIDLGLDIPCIDVLQSLYGSYVNVMSGSRARIRMGARWSEYHPGNAVMLRDLYMQIYRMCDDPQKCKLPDLSMPTIQRGPPVGGCYPPTYGPIAGQGWPYRRS